MAGHQKSYGEFDKLVPTKHQKYVFIDTEFSHDFLDRCLLHEVTLLDIQGNIIFDVMIDWQESVRQFRESHLETQFNGLDLNGESGWATFARGADGPRVATLQSLHAKMQELGINLETRVIEWSLNGIDTRILRKFFRLFGLDDVLELERTVLPYHAWRKLLPGVPLLFFPIMFPDDVLVGRNHHSCPDTQMLYKLTQQLCKLMDSDGGRVLNHLLGPEASNEQTFGSKYSSAITPPSAWRREVSMGVDDSHQKTNARGQRDQREGDPPALARPSSEATASSQETQDIPKAPGKEKAEAFARQLGTSEAPWTETAGWGIPMRYGWPLGTKRFFSGEFCGRISNHHLLTLISQRIIALSSLCGLGKRRA